MHHYYHDLQGEGSGFELMQTLIALYLIQGYMKGYVSHEKRTVVLAKSGPFPPLSARKQPK
jgi:hypothetical protein